MPTDGLPTQSYDQTTNRITTAGYEYDPAGNLIRGQGGDGTWQRYLYDAAGRLTIIRNDAGIDILYNGYTSSRQRLFANDALLGLSWYVWGGSQVISEYKSNTWGSDPLVWKKSYIHSGSRLLSTFTNNGAGSETLEFHHPDRLGTKLVTNNTANTSFEQSTLPFGTSLDAETTGTTNQRFTSYDRSTVAQLDYAVNRSYSAGQGRFTQPDPIGMGATNLSNPQSLNMYAYVGNNPIDFVDPTGLFKTDPNIFGEVDIVDEGGGEIESALASLLSSIIDRSLIDLPLYNTPDPLGVVDVIDHDNDDSLPNNLREKVEALANDCGSFLTRFLTALGGNNVESLDFGKLFNRINKISVNGKEFASDSIALGISKKENYTGTPREIIINPARIPTYVNRDIHVIQVVVQELLHHAKRTGLFSDKQLDSTALRFYEKTGEKAQKEAYMQKERYEPGGVGHGLINANCFAKVRRD